MPPKRNYKRSTVAERSTATSVKNKKIAKRNPFIDDEAIEGQEENAEWESEIEAMHEDDDADGETPVRHNPPIKRRKCANAAAFLNEDGEEEEKENDDDALCLAAAENAEQHQQQQPRQIKTPIRPLPNAVTNAPPRVALSQRRSNENVVPLDFSTALKEFAGENVNGKKKEDEPKKTKKPSNVTCIDNGSGNVINLREKLEYKPMTVIIDSQCRISIEKNAYAVPNSDRIVYYESLVPHKTLKDGTDLSLSFPTYTIDKFIDALQQIRNSAKSVTS